MLFDILRLPLDAGSGIKQQVEAGKSICGEVS
jgi:hypothetical protein